MPIYKLKRKIEDKALEVYAYDDLANCLIHLPAFGAKLVSVLANPDGTIEVTTDTALPDDRVYHLGLFASTAKQADIDTEREAIRLEDIAKG